MTGRHQTTVSTNIPCKPEMPLSLKLRASVCRNEGKLGTLLLEESTDIPDDALSDVQRFWKTVVKLLAPLEVDDVLLELELNA